MTGSEGWREEVGCEASAPVSLGPKAREENEREGKMLGVVMLAAAVPTLPAVSYYLPPRKNTLAPVGQPPVAMILVSPVENRCVTAHKRCVRRQKICVFYR